MSRLFPPYTVNGRITVETVTNSSFAQIQPNKKMLLSHYARNQISKVLLCISSSISQFASQSSSSSSSSYSPNVSSPPRKGKQAVRRILHLLSESQNPSLFEALKTLETSPQNLSSRQASALITAVGSPLISFDFYRFLKSWRPVFQPDSDLYCSLIKSQLQSINPHIPRIQFYLDEMKKQKISFSCNDLCCLFGLVVPKYVEIAGFLVREVVEKGEFDERGYNCAISVYAKHGFCEEALLVAQGARARAEKLSLEFFGCVMEVYSVNGDAREAMKLFFEMEERGILADEGIHRVLLRILCGVRWVKLCLVILEEMKRVGYRPDECLARDLVRVFIKENMVSELGYFIKEGILRDRESMALVVGAMAEECQPITALELIRSMQESRVLVDGSVYASLIHGCGKMGLIEEAARIFDEFKSSKVVEEEELVYSSMVYIYSRAEMRKMAEIVFREMEAKVGLMGKTNAFLHMMSMYAALGRFGDLIKMFEELKKRCGAGTEAYAILIDALCKAGKLNQARDCLLEMGSFGICPTNSIYSSMMEGYLQLGLINHAIPLVNEYKISGLKVDEMIARSIILVLIQAGRYSELKTYLNKLISLGIKISRDRGSLLVDVCRDDHCLRKIGQMLEQETSKAPNDSNRDY